MLGRNEQHQRLLMAKTQLVHIRGQEAPKLMHDLVPASSRPGRRQSFGSSAASASKQVAQMKLAPLGAQLLLISLQRKQSFMFAQLSQRKSAFASRALCLLFIHIGHRDATRQVVPSHSFKSSFWWLTSTQGPTNSKSSSNLNTRNDADLRLEPASNCRLPGCGLKCRLTFTNSSW